MLFDSSLRKELARGFGATLVVLVTVVMTMMLIRTLGQAARGSVAPSDVMLVMGFTVLGQLPTILCLSLFMAIVATLSRMYRDSEMVIWFTAGRGLTSFLRPLLRFAWPVLLGVATLSMLVWPWANRQVQDLKVRYEQRSDVDRITPGEFQESAGGTRVFFIDRDSSETEGANQIFIATTEPQRETVMSARSARLEVRDGERLAILSQGQRLETLLGTEQPGLRVSEFEEYGTRVGSLSTSNDTQQVTAKILETHVLAQSAQPAHQAELGWRIGLALAVINLTLWGLALAAVNPRVGRSASLVFALLAFMVYYNLMAVGQSWVAAGRWPLASFMLALHGGMLALGLLLLTIRHHQWSPLSLWRTSGMRAAA